MRFLFSVALMALTLAGCGPKVAHFGSVRCNLSKAK